ncbi:MAG: LptE family protein [Paludibacteraceae bacterium]|nr:LptE family protein [Paludibacteraceae bacterium]
MLLKKGIFLWLAVLIVGLNSCTISYKFNGASIDYTKTRSISIADFPNTAELVHPPFSQEFSEKLRDTYTKQTRLQVLKKGGDMHLEGEITGYVLTPMAISADTYASQTKLTVTIKVRFSNNKNPNDDFEKSYSAYQTFDSNLMLNDVQDELLKTMIDEITDNIYNDTVAKW